MNVGRSSSSRGAALLLVLAVLVVAVTALAPLAQLSSQTLRDRRIRIDSAVADDLMHASAAPITRWLNEESFRVVLPPRAPSPALLILEDTWSAAGTEVRLAITAYDQLAMVPIQLIGVDRLLTMSLPDDVQDLAPSTRSGLDLLRGRHSSRPVFPAPHADGRLALGELVSTHNPPGNRVAPSGDAPAINVNTAPMPLVEAALLAAGRGGAAPIRASRAAGRPFATTGDQEAGSAERGLSIVGSSTSWSFRIDISAGRARRSWWAVYGHRGSSWERAQLLAITD